MSEKPTCLHQVTRVEVHTGRDWTVREPCGLIAHRVLLVDGKRLINLCTRRGRRCEKRYGRFSGIEVEVL